MNIGSNSELALLIDRNSSGFIRNKNYVGFTENLLESKWIYHVINLAITSKSGRTNLAEIASSFVQQNLGIDHSFTANDFDLTHSKYDVLTQDGKVKKKNWLNWSKLHLLLIQHKFKSKD